MGVSVFLSVFSLSLSLSCPPAYTYLPNDLPVSLFAYLWGQLIRGRGGATFYPGTSSAGSGASQAAPFHSFPLPPCQPPIPSSCSAVVLQAVLSTICLSSHLSVFFFHLSLSFTFHICLSCFLSHCCCPFSPPLSVCSLGTISSTISSYLSHYVFISFFL